MMPVVNEIVVDLIQRVPLVIAVLGAKQVRELLLEGAREVRRVSLLMVAVLGSHLKMIRGAQMQVKSVLIFALLFTDLAVVL